MVVAIEQAVIRAQAISLRQLRFFVALADHGHFGRAAEAAVISQPALSAAIRQIEAHLGLRLFDRTTHRVALTDAGRSLLPHAQRLLTTADNAFADMRDVVTRETATVRIGAIPSAVSAVAEVLTTSGNAIDGISVHVSDGKSEDLLKGLRQGVYDMIVSVSAVPDQDTEAVTVVEDEMLLVACSDHPLAMSAKLPWSALDGVEIVHFAGGSIGELSSAALQQNGLAPSARFKIDQVDSLYGLVRSGLAVGVMPKLYTRAFGEERLSLIPLIRPAVKRRVKLLHRRQLRDEHPVAARFCDHLSNGLKAVFSA